jgi:hypothetical protein
MLAVAPRETSRDSYGDCRAVEWVRLRLVRAEGHSVGLRLPSDRRDDLAEQRTRTVNRLHALLRDLIAGGAKRDLTATTPPN